MKKRILQSIANSIIKMIATAPDSKAIEFYYQMGISLDTYSSSMGIELE